MERSPAHADFLVENPDLSEQTSDGRIPLDVEYNLVRSAQAGSEESFEALYRHYAPRVNNYLSFRVGRQDAEDVTAITFLDAYRGLPKLELREGARFSGWLFKIAHNRAIDHLLARKDSSALHESIVDSSGYGNPEIAVQARVDLQVLRETLQRVPPLQRSALLMRSVGMAHVEIADALNVSVGYSRNLAYRGLNTLLELAGNRFSALDLGEGAA